MFEMDKVSEKALFALGVAAVIHGILGIHGETPIRASDMDCVQIIMDDGSRGIISYNEIRNIELSYKPFGFLKDINFYFLPTWMEEERKLKHLMMEYQKLLLDKVYYEPIRTR